MILKIMDYKGNWMFYQGNEKIVAGEICFDGSKYVELRPNTTSRKLNTKLIKEDMENGVCDVYDLLHDKIGNHSFSIPDLDDVDRWNIYQKFVLLEDKNFIPKPIYEVHMLVSQAYLLSDSGCTIEKLN